MISPMTTARPQQRYDHRLCELVHRTGDLTIATDLGVPPSTARGWLGTAPTVVVSLEVAVEFDGSQRFFLASLPIPLVIRFDRCKGDVSRRQRIIQF